MDVHKYYQRRIGILVVLALLGIWVWSAYSTIANWSDRQLGGNIKAKQTHIQKERAKLDAADITTHR